MSATESEELEVINYFIDEAGDPVLFSKRGKKVLVGDGSSKFFMLGKILVEDCERLRSELDALRAQLLADPYFRDVPSMQVERKKTARLFHARDDLPEIRREVFRLIAGHDIKFYAVIRSKEDLVNFVRQQNDRDPDYRYNENELYDTLITHLFSKLRRSAEEVNVYFARRGRSDRTAALKAAIAEAEKDFEKKFGFQRKQTVKILPRYSREDACLQACDYFLWALQRHYELGESRYIQLIWNQVGEIHDLDKEHGSRRGIFYNAKNPLVP
ncbi:DUF3800 domain-containing protein [Aeoliella sp. SH292]|uniref:DUF3800 domain-containing protein n=1 Tax=Aeoliella sp. SH292 TaxID=3454464 RepID=UPI003F9E09C7